MSILMKKLDWLGQQYGRRGKISLGVRTIFARSARRGPIYRAHGVEEGKTST